MRRMSALLVAATLAVGSLTLSRASAAPVANWPQERGGAPHRGWNQDETTLSVANVAGLKPGWGGRSIINSSYVYEPTVVGSTIYFVQSDPDYGARVEAKDVATAKSMWWWSRNGDPMGPAILANGMLYWLVTGWPDGRPVNDGRRSMLYALDPATGAVIWKADTAGHATSSLTVEGKVAVTTSRLANGRTRYTFWNALNGKVIKDGTSSGPVPLGTTQASIASGRVFLVADRLVALSMSGVVQWTFNGVPSNPQTPVVSSDMVYVPGQSRIVAVDPVTGKQRFAIASGGAVAVDGSRLYKVTYAGNGVQSALEAFNRRTGVKLWSVPLPGGEAPDRQVPTVANGVVYTVLADGVGAYDASDGRLLWHWTGGGRGRVVVASGNVYFSDSDTYGAVQFHL